MSSYLSSIARCSLRLLLFIFLLSSSALFSQSMSIEDFKDDFLSRNCNTPDKELDRLKLDKKRFLEITSLMRSIENLDKRNFEDYTDFIFNYIPFAYWSWQCGVLVDYNIFNRIRFAPWMEQVEFEFITGEESRIIAKAHSPRTDDVRFIIDIDKWENLNNYERLWMILHEFGHEAFGLGHAKGGPLMYPLLPQELKNNNRDLKLERRYREYLDLSIEKIAEPDRLTELEEYTLSQGSPLSILNGDLVLTPLLWGSYPSNEAFNILMESAFDFITYVSNERTYSEGTLDANDYYEVSERLDPQTRFRGLDIPYKINYIGTDVWDYSNF